MLAELLFCLKLLRITQGPICEILATIAQLLVVVEKLSFFESAILIFFCFIPMKISQIFLGSKDGPKFWWLFWFPCSKICNTVYEGGMKYFIKKSDISSAENVLRFKSRVIICLFWGNKKSTVTLESKLYISSTKVCSL